MEQQQLLANTALPVIHSAVPAQVRLEPTWGGFDECVPFALQGRVDPSHYAATMHGLSTIIKNNRRIVSMVMFVGMMLFFGSVTMLVLSIFYFFDNIFMWYPLVFGSAIGLAISSFVAAFIVRKRILNYLGEVNREYNPMGLNFRIERYYRQWSLVIDILPLGHNVQPVMVVQTNDYSRATGATQMPPAYQYPNPDFMGTSTTQQQQQQQQYHQGGAFIQAPYSFEQVSYNGKTYEAV